MLRMVQGKLAQLFDTREPVGCWISSIGVATGVAIAYFLAARLSLFLLTKPDGVAVFWPAAGVSSGILIASGREMRLPVVSGVMAATIVANLLSDRNLSSSLVFALSNAGEAVVTAWLIERHFGLGFSLVSLPRVWDCWAQQRLAPRSRALAEHSDLFSSTAQRHLFRLFGATGSHPMRSA